MFSSKRFLQAISRNIESNLEKLYIKMVHFGVTEAHMNLGSTAK